MQKLWLSLHQESRRVCKGGSSEVRLEASDARAPSLPPVLLSALLDMGYIRWCLGLDKDVIFVFALRCHFTTDDIYDQEGQEFLQTLHSFPNGKAQL